MTPRIFEAFERDAGDAVFDPAPRAAPQRLCACLAARFGAMNLPQLRRIAADESAAALRLVQGIETPFFTPAPAPP